MMKKGHHQLIGLNTLAVVEMIRNGDVPIPADPALGKILKPVEQGKLDLLKVGEKANRKSFKNYLKAPDMVEDVYIDMPLWIDDRYEFCNHGLSAFQHFVTPTDENRYRGYNWDCDDSLSLLDEAGDIVMTLLSTDVKYDAEVEAYGFSKKIMAESPMSQWVGNGSVDLDDFQFPSAADVGGYYADVAKKQEPQSMIKLKAAAFSLHFVMDSCCAHHASGYLMNGHSDWEKGLELNWRGRFGDPKDQGRVKKKLEGIAEDVLVGLAEAKGKCNDLVSAGSVEKVIELNADFVAKDWLKDKNEEMAMDGKINHGQAKEICIRAIASSLISLSLMFA